MLDIKVFRQRQADAATAMAAAVGTDGYEAASLAFKAATEARGQAESALEAERIVAAAATPPPVAAVATSTTPQFVEAMSITAVEGTRQISFGEQLIAMKNKLVGNAYDKRLDFMAAPTGASEGAPVDGGYAVGFDTTSQIWTKMYSTGQILKRVNRVQVSAGSNRLVVNAVDESSRATGSRYGGVQGYWVSEGNNVTSSRPKFRRVDLNLKKVAALFYATDELLSDATALEQIVTTAMTEELVFLTEDGIINGLGGGLPQGILKSPALVTQNKDSGQATLTLTATNIANMRGRMWARSWNNAVWLCHQDVLAAVYTLTLGNYPIFFPAGQFSNDVTYDTLMGRPIIPVEYCASFTNLGDIIFADLSQYQLIDKGPATAAMSIHVQFVNDEIVYRWMYRVDGMPLWNAALTPYKGSNTQSPFVTLQAR